MSEATGESLAPQSPETFSWWQVWTTIFTHPKVEAYENLINDPKAGSRRALLWIFLSNLIGYLVLMLPVGAWVGVLSLIPLSEVDSTELGPVLVIIFASLFPILIITAVIGLLVYVGILHLIAKLLGGNGSYSKLLYLFAAYMAPFTLIYCILSFLPFISLLAIPLIWYGFYIQVVAVKTIHRFSCQKAAAVIFVPVFINMMIATVFFFLYFIGLFFVVFASQFPDLFPVIIQNLTAFAP